MFIFLLLEDRKVLRVRQNSVNLNIASFSFITGPMDIVVPRKASGSLEVSEKPALAVCTILKRNQLSFSVQKLYYYFSTSK